MRPCARARARPTLPAMTNDLRQQLPPPTKTAILISGQTRTFKKCYPTQLWHLYRNLNEPHFFVSVADDEQAADVEILRQDFEHVFIERVAKPLIPELPQYREATAHAPYNLIVPIQSVLRQLWHMERVWDFLRESAKLPEFAAFFRIRPDSFFHYYQIQPDLRMAPAVYVPFWGSYGGLNDRFAMIFGRRQAELYFTTYQRLLDLVEAGCPFHPESLLAASLELASVPIHRTLPMEFSTVRLDGDARPWVSPDVRPGDIVRFLEAQRSIPRVVQSFLPPGLVGKK